LKLDVTIGGIRFRNPLLLASGILGDNPALLRRVYESSAGGLVTKSITKEKREGYRTPIVVGVKCGFINAVGLANPGIEGIRDLVKAAKEIRAPIIVSIAGSTIEEFVEIAEEAKKYGADGVELNFSCPHAEKRGLELSDDIELVEDIIKSVKELGIVTIPKFGIKDNLSELIKVAEDSKADAVTLINTIKAMKIDVWTKRPVLSNVFGGLSGPAIHPIAVRVVYEAYEITKLPIIGVGGVVDWESAVEMFLAGATAVQIGSAIALKGLKVFKEIIDGIRYYLSEQGFNDIKEIIGLAHKQVES